MRQAGPAPTPARNAAEEAYEYALRLLAQAPRTQSLIRDRLERAGFGAATEAVLCRLAAARLVDDEAYARDFVEARTRRRPLGKEALIAELSGRGVEPEAAARVVDEADYDEAAAAVELAAARLPRLASLPLASQARRLYGFLAARGFSEEVAEAAVRRVMPPEGWD